MGGLLSRSHDCPTLRLPRSRAERRKQSPRTPDLQRETLHTHVPGRTAQRWPCLPFTQLGSWIHMCH